MKGIIGPVLIVIGTVLLVLGLSAADSLASDISRFFTGNPTDRAVWLLIAGLGAIAAGAAVMAARRGRNSP